jgi:hypothetical protein
MNFKIIISLISLGLFASSAGATEYIYRDIMANTLPGAQCQTHDKATEAAQKNYTLDRFSKKVCQTQGYGWHLDEIQNIGETVCTPCSDKPQLQKCSQKDVTVSCKRIKPGTVGMLPGKG